jgi:uncharacterized protein with von Willebrand factor type A (vWA) domain
MERIVVCFVDKLRQKGIQVSPGEYIDAVRGLAICGIERRETTKKTLQLTLVKQMEDLPVFEEVFAEFFSPGRQEGNLDDTGLNDLVNIVIENSQEIDGMFVPVHQSEVNLTLVVDNDDEVDLEDMDLLEAGSAQGAGVTKTSHFYRGGKLAKPSPVNAPSANEQMTGELVEGLTGIWANQGMKIFSEAEQREMEELVTRMVQRLKKNIRQTRRKQQRGKLLVTKTLQKNYRNEMVPFIKHFSRKTKQKPRLLVLCDVSYSVSHASRFMLLLVHTMQNKLLEVRSFIFNKELAEISSLLKSLDINRVLELIEKGSVVNLNENSDFGHAFLTFREKFQDNIRGRPAVIFLGDARNNYNPPNDWVLGEIKERAGYMLWLTPEEKNSWDLGDCLIEKYGSYCNQVEVVKNIAELSSKVEELVIRSMFKYK